MRPHLDDARVEVAIVGEDARLRPGELIASSAARVDRHREQRHRHALARREEHVELAARRLVRRAPVVGGALRERDELVRGLAHRAHDDDDVVTCALRSDDAVGDLARSSATSATDEPPYFWTMTLMGPRY